LVEENKELFAIINIEEYKRQIDNCLSEQDIVLYVITPKMTGTYAIAEAVDDSNKRPARTIFVRLREDGSQKFDEAQWKSLGAVSQLIERNGGTAFSDLKTVAIAINNQTQKEGGSQ
jgi:hypothetical protein